EVRNSEHLAQKLAEAKNMTFARCADECLDVCAKKWVPSTTRQAERLIRRYLLPALGNLPVNVIDVRQVCNVLKPLCETKPATALKVREYLHTVLDWATASECRTGNNPAAWSGPIKKLLPNFNNHKVKHHKALPFEEIGAFMARLRNFRAKKREGIEESEESLNALLLQLIILTAVRTRQAQEARWAEFNLDDSIWTCPPERPKT